MSGDKFSKTQVGKPLEIPAATWNAMIDAARHHALSQHDQKASEDILVRQADLIKVRNQSGADLSRFSILGIDAPIVTPTDKLREFKNQVAVDAVAPTTDTRGRFVILLDPLAAGKVGRAWASGLCAVKIDIKETWHQAADIADGSMDALEVGHRVPLRFYGVKKDSD